MNNSQGSVVCKSLQFFYGLYPAHGSYAENRLLARASPTLTIFRPILQKHAEVHGSASRLSSHLHKHILGRSDTDGSAT